MDHHHHYTPYSSHYSAVSTSSSTYSSTPIPTSMAANFTTFDRLSNTSAETTLFGCISLALGKFLHSSSGSRRKRISSTRPTYPSADDDDQLLHQQFKDSTTLGGLMMKGYPDNGCGGGSATPNIVARLMGLDSIPETDSSPASNTAATTTTSSHHHHTKFTRTKSRSMGSSPLGWTGPGPGDRASPLPPQPPANETKVAEGSNRRRGTRSSFSLRATPGFFELEEDDDFLVLKFDNGRRKTKEKEVDKKTSEAGAMMRRSSSSSRRAERDIRGCRSMESIPGFAAATRCDQEITRSRSLKIPESGRGPIMLVNQMPNWNGGRRNNKRRRRKKKRRSREKWLLDVKLEIESDDAENSSPVSVLDQSEFVASSDHEVITSEDDRTRSQTLSPTRRRLLSELWRMENNKSPPPPPPSSPTSSAECTPLSSPRPQGGENAVTDEIEINKSQKVEPAPATGLARKDYHKLENAEMLRRVCRLAEIDLQQSSNCWGSCGRSTRRLGGNPSTTSYWEGGDDEIGSELGDGGDGEIGSELGLLIADELIEQLVIQLVSF